MNMVCDWFAMCTEQATSQVEHPTLGWVDICEKHLKWLGPNPSPTQFVPPLAANTLKKYPQVKDMMSGNV